MLGVRCCATGAIEKCQSSDLFFIFHMLIPDLKALETHLGRKHNKKTFKRTKYIIKSQIWNYRAFKERSIKAYMDIEGEANFRIQRRQRTHSERMPRGGEKKVEIREVGGGMMEVGAVGTGSRK